MSHCFIADNDEAGIFYEISYSLYAHDNLIVNNPDRGESVGGAWGTGGITLSSSEECRVENNTLVGNRDGIDFREQDRSTPRIDGPHGAQEGRILNRGHLIGSSIVAFSQAYNIGFWMDTNFFGPHPSGDDRNKPIFADPKTLSIRLESDLVYAQPGRPNYLYGVPWRGKSKTANTPAEFAAVSGIPDTDRAAEERLETTRRDILRILTIRFGAVPIGVEEKLRWVREVVRLEVLFEGAMRCPDLESFRAELD